MAHKKNKSTRNSTKSKNILSQAKILRRLGLIDKKTDLRSVDINALGKRVRQFKSVLSGELSVIKVKSETKSIETSSGNFTTREFKSKSRNAKIGDKIGNVIIAPKKQNNYQRRLSSKNGTTRIVESSSKKMKNGKTSKKVIIFTGSEQQYPSAINEYRVWEKRNNRNVIDYNFLVTFSWKDNNGNEQYQSSYYSDIYDADDQYEILLRGSKSGGQSSAVHEIVAVR